MWVTGSRRRFAWGATAATLAVLVAVLITLWQYPRTELVIFHCVWIGLAVLALRTPSPHVHSWALVSIVTGLALIIEVKDVSSGTEGIESLVELVLDFVAFVALVYLARSHRQALAVEHEATVAEHDRNERQRAFFANASHALRTPITVARGHAELVLTDTMSPSARADVAVVLEELDRLTKATDRILRLSVAGKLDPQRHQQVEVDELVRATVERWRPAAPRVWSAEPKCAGVTILADQEALTEAFDALVDNAVAATWPGGAIAVGSRMEGANVVLSVTDDGLGVDGVDTLHLFDPFQRGARRSSQGSSGTGLGLAIVRAIANAHGGDAAMHTTPGHGVTVAITLPCNDSSAPRPTVGSPQPIVAL